jgi:CDP-diacylglycerol--glycerol-3-phosphate 3-phosphatidyltransferase
MNWANRVTILRLIFIPIIGILMTLPSVNGVFYGVLTDWELHVGSYHLNYLYLIAGILFIIASLTDMLDGYLARKYNQVTTFGKFFDSIADKLLTNTVLIIFAVCQILPVWMVVLLICRDFLIDVVRQILATSNVVMAANKLGKYRAAVEMLGLTILFFVGWTNFTGATFSGTGEYGYINQIVMIPMYVATLLSVISAFNYIALNRRVLFAGMKNPKKDVEDEKK